MANLHLTVKIGNRPDFNRSDVMYIDADMLDGTHQRISAAEIDKLIVDSFAEKIDMVTVHTADDMMHRFKMAEWLVIEAD